MRHDESMRPLLAVGLAIFLLSGMDAMVKLVASSYSTWQIVLLRYVFGLLAIAPIYWWRERARPRSSTLRNSALRGLTAMATAYCFFYSLALIPLIKAVALSFSAPLFMVLVARVILGEPITSRAVLAIALGGSGVVVALWQQLFEAGSGGSLTGELAALAAAFFYALSVVLTRLHGQSDNAHSMVFTQAICITAYALPFGAWQWRPLDGADFLTFALMGAIGTGATLLMAWGFARAPASRLGPLEYTNLVWTSILGFVVFAEVPTAYTVAGGTLIVAASVLAGTRPVHFKARHQRP